MTTDELWFTTSVEEANQLSNERHVNREEKQGPTLRVAALPTSQ
jgi:hypothetical protein